ncbi:DUF1129 domain-containing protein [Fundicoccus sp. Sow4_D5]|uniref:DUF1129 domain-containing protein n=1 Tax=Fundicoccus sp. Sow4_D5 TaxID=3438782 RepID=UPI003F906462
MSKETEKNTPIVDPNEADKIQAAKDAIKASTGTKVETNANVVETTQVSPVAPVAVNPLPGLEWDEFNQLTKRSQQFLVSIDKKLTDGGLTEAVKMPIYTEMLETLIEGQQVGQTARQIYGTPTECATSILNQNFQDQTEVTRSPDWQIALDGGLILGSVFTFIVGLSMMNANAEQPEAVLSMGLITLILNYLVAGWAMLQTSKVMPNMEAPKGKKGYFKYFGVSSLWMIVWVAVVTLSAAFIPSVINPIFPPMVYMVIGAATFGLRFYLKKRYNIVGGVF